MAVGGDLKNSEKRLRIVSICIVDFFIFFKNQNVKPHQTKIGEIHPVPIRLYYESYGACPNLNVKELVL
jgi:hypothetical protein